MRGDWSNLRGVVKGDTMSEVEVEYKVRRWERPALIGFVVWVVGRVTSSF